MLTFPEAIELEDKLKTAFEDVQVVGDNWLDNGWRMVIHAKGHNRSIPSHKCDHKLTMIARNISTCIDADGYLSSRSKEPLGYNWIKHCICGRVVKFDLFREGVAPKSEVDLSNISED